MRPLLRSGLPQRFRVSSKATKPVMRAVFEREVGRLEDRERQLLARIYQQESENRELFNTLKELKGGRFGSAFARDDGTNVGELWLAVAGLSG